MRLCSPIGEIQYRQRLEDIRLLKLEIKKLRREKNILTKSVANVEDLRWDHYLLLVVIFSILGVIVEFRFSGLTQCKKNLIVFAFTVCVGAKYITRNVNFSESERDARRWKRNSKTR